MVVTLHYGTWIIYYLIIASISFIGILAGSGPVNLFVESIPQNLMNGLSALADFTCRWVCYVNETVMG